MIRFAKMEDEPYIYRLLCELEGEELDREGFERTFLEYEKLPGYFCLAAEENGSVAGILTLRTGPMLCRAGRIGEIVEFVVDQELRSQGIGHSLFEEARAIAIQEGCERLEVSSNKVRTGAHRFYEREGMAQSHYKFVQLL